MNRWPEEFALGKATRLPAFNPASERCVDLRSLNVKDFMQMCADNHAQDSADAAAYEVWIGRTSNQFSREEKGKINEAIKEANKREASCKHFEYHLTPKSIEQSADHKTVVILWNDRTKTIVRLSENDKDDIDTAFAYALAKKVFGSNTHLKKVVRQKLNEHKPKAKRLPSDPNPKEIPVEFEYIKAAKELFLESHFMYNVQIDIDLMDTRETCVNMYTSREGIIKYMKNVESTQDALSQLESMWQELTTEKEDQVND